VLVNRATRLAQIKHEVQADIFASSHTAIAAHRHCKQFTSGLSRHHLFALLSCAGFQTFQLMQLQLSNSQLFSF